MIDLAPQDLTLVEKILQQSLPDVEVWAFGSRTSGQARHYSDLDLVVLASEKLDRQILYRLEDAFIESDLPFRVDILDWHRLSDSFQKIIRLNHYVIQSPSDSQG